jgi:hypothetical protein
MIVWVPDDLLRQRLERREEGRAEVILEADIKSGVEASMNFKERASPRCMIHNTGTQEKMNSGYHTRLNNQTPWKIRTYACLLFDLRNLCSGLMQKNYSSSSRYLSIPLLISVAMSNASSFVEASKSYRLVSFSR